MKQIIINIFTGVFRKQIIHLRYIINLSLEDFKIKLQETVDTEMELGLDYSIRFSPGSRKC